MRRSRQSLESAVCRARTDSSRAKAFYALGLFHDNNSREAEAIPCYSAALELGLPKSLRAKALAWLASSLWKTGNPTPALLCIRAALPQADARLRGFLKDLEARIIRRPVTSR